MGFSGAMMAAGTAMNAYGQIQAGNAAAAQGRAQQTAANYRATLLDQQAGQERASSQRTAIEQRRQAGLVASRAQAVAAASGAGATDPTVNTIEANIAGRGEYNALTALFNGEERARGLEEEGVLSRFEGTQYAAAGEARRSAATIGAIGSVLTGAGSLYAKYGQPTATPAPQPLPDYGIGDDYSKYTMAQRAAYSSNAYY